jgi:enolase
MDYAMKGVGTEEGCALQIIADHSCTSSEDISRLDGEKIFNAVKISLVKFGSITEAFHVCKAANQFNWKIVVGTEDKNPETMETFLSDFAVAVGACQFNIGGIGSGEHSCKLNRLLEISREDFGINFVGRKFRI